MYRLISLYTMVLLLLPDVSLVRREAVMPVNNGIIVAPITSPSDVEQVLGYSVGGDVGVACSNQRVIGRDGNGNFILAPGNINKWAKYKPVIYSNALVALSDDQTKGSLKDLGLTVKNVNTGANIGGTLQYSLSNVKSLRNYNWFHNAPYGTMNAPFRLTDFNRYNHHARQFLLSQKTSDYTVEVNIFGFVNGYGNFLLYFVKNTDLPDSQQYEIRLSDLVGSNISNTNIGNMYFAVIIENKKNGGWRFLAHPERIGTDPSTVGVDLTVGSGEFLSQGNEYNVYAFLADNYKDDTEEPNLVERVFPLPWDTQNSNVFNLKVTSEFPATAKITGIGVLNQNFIPNQDSIRPIDGVTYYAPEYYDVYYGQNNPLHPWTNNNICFEVEITNIRTRIVMRKDQFVMKRYGDNKSYQLFVQEIPDSSASGDASKTIVLDPYYKGVIYMISPTVGSAPAGDNLEEQFTLSVRGATLDYSPWIRLE